MKSYTDLQQSKKLAEILPLESADMCWFEGEPFVEAVTGYEEERAESHRQAGMEMYPCWSLAALFNVLPKNLNIGRPSLESNYKGYYWIQYYDEFMKPNNYRTECFNNPIDACYEMILKLHELKLL